MKVGRQLYAPTALLPDKKPQISVGYKAGWASGPPRGGEKMYVPVLGIEEH